ncbi:MAG: hypothetical protein HY562_05590 [Ignavibacteriales bacterium]|nr:hypothetical protein [Ignavibacteriales bacterium]
MTTPRGVKPHIHWLRLFAKALALLWGFFWALFGLLSALGEELDFLATFMHILVPGFAFLLTALVAFRFEKAGGIALMLEGFIVAIVYPMIFRGMASSTVVFVLLTMALPPIISGVLFVLDWKKFHLLPNG